MLEFKHLGTALTNQNHMHEGFTIILSSGNVCYRSVQNLLPFSLLSKSSSINIFGTVILLVVLYGCKTSVLHIEERTCAEGV